MLNHTSEKYYTTMERQKLGSPIQSIKTEIPIERYAGELTELKSYGDELRGCCPIHKGDNPTSFSVNVEKQLFHCHACGEGGDLLDLCEVVEKHADTWTALLSLAMRFNVELPAKPDKHLKWADQKAEIRSFNEKIRYERRIRRWFRIFHQADLAAIADPEERRAETEHTWRELRTYMPRSDWWGAGA
jgi:hypothetical protein